MKNTVITLGAILLFIGFTGCGGTSDALKNEQITKTGDKVISNIDDVAKIPTKEEINTIKKELEKQNTIDQVDVGKKAPQVDVAKKLSPKELDEIKKSIGE